MIRCILLVFLAALSVLNAQTPLPAVRLDTTDARAADLLTLHIHGFPRRDTAAQSLQGDMTIRIRFDQRALFLRDARLLPDNIPLAVTAADSGASTLILYEMLARVDSGSVVAITFRGLSTGQPENIVLLEEVTLGDSTLPTPAHGLVRLSGCDVDRGLRLGKHIALDAVTIAPDGSSLTLAYQASPGSRPHLNLYNLAGSRISSAALREADGSVESHTLLLSGRSRGFHLLELRDGAERLVVPLMIAR